MVDDIETDESPGFIHVQPHTINLMVTRIDDDCRWTAVTFHGEDAGNVMVVEIGDEIVAMIDRLKNPPL